MKTLRLLENGARTLNYRAFHAGSIDAASDEVMRDARTVLRFPGHSSTDQAVSHLASGLSLVKQLALLVGHGWPGLIITGGGEETGNPFREITLDNEPIWTPFLGRLRGRVRSLRLLSCWTGGGADGAALLERMACAIDAPVFAPTGAVLFSTGHDAVILERGNRWQKGVCEQHSSLMDFAPSFYTKHAAPLIPAPFDPGTVTSFRVERVDVEGRYEVMAGRGRSAQRLAEMLDLERPFFFESRISAARSGYITVVDDAGLEHEFEVLGDRLFRHDQYYYSMGLLTFEMPPARKLY